MDFGGHKVEGKIELALNIQQAIATMVIMTGI